MPEEDDLFDVQFQEVHGFPMPYAYQLWRDGVYRWKFLAEVSGAHYYPDIEAKTPQAYRKLATRVTSRPLFVTGLGRSIDTGEQLVRITFEPLGGGLASQWVDLSQMASRRRLVELSSIGVPVDDDSSAEVLIYLRAAVAALNQKGMVNLVATRTGPHFDPNDKHLLGWLIGQRWLPNTANVAPDPRQASSYAGGFRTHGDLAAWLGKWREIREQSWVARWLVAATFAAPLLRLVDRRTFFIHVWGDSRYGKTAIAKFAMSAWGDPEQLMSTFNQTQVAAVEIFRYFTDIPVCYDERQAANRNFDIGEFIYSVANSKGRPRGARNGGLRNDIPTWRTVAFTTGEQPLIGDTDLGGQSTRVLEVDVAGAPRVADAGALHAFTVQNHGHAGPAFIERLIDACRATDAIPKLQQIYGNLRTDLKSTAPLGTKDEHIAHVAVVALAQLLSDMWLLGENAQVAKARAVEDSERMLQMMNGGTTAAPQEFDERALEWLRGHRTTQHRRYLNLRSLDHDGNYDQVIRAQVQEAIATSHEIVGIEWREGIWYIPAAINPLLTAAGYTPQRVWRDFGQRGWLVTNPNERHFSVKRQFGGRRQRVYVIRREVFSGYGLSLVAAPPAPMEDARDEVAGPQEEHIDDRPLTLDDMVAPLDLSGMSDSIEPPALRVVEGER